MPPSKKIDSIPSLPQKAIETALKKSLLRGRDMGIQFSAFYVPLTLGFREEMTGHFFTNFKEVDPKTKQPVWDLSVARKAKSYARLEESFIDMVDSADTEAGIMMDEDLTEELDEGFDHGLWALSQSGIDISEAERWGDFDTRKALLIAAGILGISYLSRIREAGSITKSRFLTWLKATIAGGRPYDETLQAYTQIMHAHGTRIAKLAENENHRSLLLGLKETETQFINHLEGSVWLANEPTACPVCLSNHLVITDELPITDSHPGCRCIKVPIALNYQGQPINYVDFLQSIGRR